MYPLYKLLMCTWDGSGEAAWEAEGNLSQPKWRVVTSAKSLELDWFKLSYSLINNLMLLMMIGL